MEKEDTDNVFIIVSDIKGFSTVPEKDCPVVYRQFYRVLLDALWKKVIKGKRKYMTAFNTWGDGMIAVFSHGGRAVQFMADYRDFFKTFEFAAHQLPEMAPRIAGHYAHVYCFDDPMIKQQNITGSGAIIPARIEPIVRPGEIYVTESFYRNALKYPDVKSEFVFDLLGLLELDKGFKFDECLYRLHRNKPEDPPLVIDRIIRQDLHKELPEPTRMTDEERRLLDDLELATSWTLTRTVLRSSALLDNLEHRSGPFLLECARLCKQRGYYQQAARCLEALENNCVKPDHLEIYTYRHDLAVLELRADVYSRQRRYAEATNLIYGAVINYREFGMKQRYAHALAVLAAQYKRHALFSHLGMVTEDEMNAQRCIDEADVDQMDITIIQRDGIDMLVRAWKLYKEAFRYDVNDGYYPAINAAYLGIMLDRLGYREDDPENPIQPQGEGKRLAQYILDSWPEPAAQSGNWWLAVTLAEAEMLLFSEYDLVSVPRFQRLFQTMDPPPPWFERQSTRVQIKIYGKIMGCLPDLANLLKELE